MPTPAWLGRISHLCPGLHFPRRAPGRGASPRGPAGTLCAAAARSPGPHLQGLRKLYEVSLDLLTDVELRLQPLSFVLLFKHQLFHSHLQGTSFQ